MFLIKIGEILKRKNDQKNLMFFINVLNIFSIPKCNLFLFVRRLCKLWIYCENLEALLVWIYIFKINITKS